MLLAIAIGSVAAASCDRREPKLSDAKIGEIRRMLPGITDKCVEKLRFGGVEALPHRTEDCFEMMQPERWQGLWRDNFEGSRFCPKPARACSYDTPGDDIWLTFSSGSGAPERTRPGNLFAIEFIGRRTKARGLYGHLGGSQHEVLVDRIITLEPVTTSRN